MSNLDFTISLLVSKRDEVFHLLNSSGTNQFQHANQIEELNKAIGILNDVKRKDEKKEMNKRISKKYKI